MRTSTPKHRGHYLVQDIFRTTRDAGIIQKRQAVGMARSKQAPVQPAHAGLLDQPKLVSIIFTLGNHAPA